MFANNLQNYCKTCTARSTQIALKSHLECATQNDLQIVFATLKNQKPLDYATQNFFATTSVQFKKTFCHAQYRTTQIPLLLELATFNATGLPPSAPQLCNFCTKGYTTWTKKTARSTSANVRNRASVQVTKTAVSTFTIGFGFYAQTVLWRFAPLHGRELQAKTHTRGVGFEKI